MSELDMNTLRWVARYFEKRREKHLDDAARSSKPEIDEAISRFCGGMVTEFHRLAKQAERERNHG